MYDKILHVIRLPAVSFRVLSDYVEFHSAYSTITLKLFRILEANFFALTIFKGTLLKKTECG
jgi:hypothetical protein